MADVNWQKIIAVGGVALGGALAALAGSDAVSPQTAAICAAIVAVLGILGVYKAPNPPKQQALIQQGVALGIAQVEQAQPPSDPEPPEHRGLP